MINLRAVGVDGEEYRLTSQVGLGPDRPFRW